MVSLNKDGGLSAEAAVFQQRVKVAFIITLLVLAGLLMFVFGSSQPSDEYLTKGVEMKTKTIQRNDEGDGRCQNVCKVVREQREEKFNGDLTHHKQLIRMATTAKNKMLRQLKKDYGEEYFSKMFEDPAQSATNASSTEVQPRYRGVSPVTPDGPATERFKKKLLMKVLSVQVELQRQNKDIRGCDCTRGGSEIRRAAENENEPILIDDTYARFVWATGGHSAAAAHGNLYNESYTAFLERDVKDVFRSIGIEFVGRNYAMGGTESCPELSMCSEAIYGTDIDMLGWDFCMTDGGEEYRILHYGYRAARNPNRPALIGVHLGGRTFKSRKRRFEELEELGMPVFFTTTPDLPPSKTIFGEVPDTQVMTGPEIAALPDFVRSFKCGSKAESGIPNCDAEKYNEFVCPARKGKASWHPGLKAHAMDGTMLALFLVQNLIDALNEYAEEDVKDPEAKLRELQNEETMRYQGLFQADLPEAARAFGTGTDPDLDIELLYKGPNLCRTARLPAQSRYLGHTTNTNAVGDVAPPYKETYFTGISASNASALAANGVLRLAYAPGERERCHVPLAPDYKDFFISHEKDGWTSMTIPNDAEKVAYNYDPTSFKGVIVVHEVVCNWGRCEDGSVRMENLGPDTLEVTVNDMPVTNITKLKGGRNVVLKGENGFFWKANDDGTYKLSVRVLPKDNFLKISSVTIY